MGAAGTVIAAFAIVGAAGHHGGTDASSRFPSFNSRRLCCGGCSPARLRLNGPEGPHSISITTAWRNAQDPHRGGRLRHPVHPLHGGADRENASEAPVSANRV